MHHSTHYTDQNRKMRTQTYMAEFRLGGVESFVTAHAHPSTECRRAYPREPSGLHALHVAEKLWAPPVLLDIFHFEGGKS